MDHFNVTVQNGAMIATRRGLQVSKQKHNGMSFVNTYSRNSDAEPAASGSSGTLSVDLSRPSQRTFRFVERQKDIRRDPGRSKPKEPQNSEDEGKSTTASKGKKQFRRRGPERRIADGSDSSGAPLSVSSPEVVSPESLSMVQSEAQSTYSADCASLPIIPSLPTWTTNVLPPWMTEDNRRIFHSHFALVPTKMYPFEDVLSHNPARSRLFYDMVVADLAALHCVLMCGALFKAVAASGGGDGESRDMAYHISRVCAVVNAHLTEGQGKRIPSITLECITTLALVGNYIGRYDHWQVHMRGLQKIIEMEGGLQGMRPSLVSKIRKTDVKGAAALGTTPYLVPFARFYPNASDAALPAETLQQITDDITAILAPLGISPTVTSSIAALTRLVAAYTTARAPRSHLTFDPGAFTEEWHAVQHRLVSEPGPLRDEGAESRPSKPPARAPSLPDTNREGTQPLVDASALRTESYVRNHRAAFARAAVRPAPCRDPLEPALRCCALLYLKELLPDFPRNLGGYSVPLALLRQHLWRFLAEGPALPLAGRGVDEGEGEDARRRREEERLAAVPPVLVWICLVGNLVSLLGDKNECRLGADCYDRSVYRECLVGLLGLTDGREVDEMGESDFALCRLLDLRSIQKGKWDSRAALKKILPEGG